MYNGEPVNVALFGKSALAGIMKLRVLRASWVTQVGSKSSDQCPYHLHTEERRKRESPCEDGDGLEWRGHRQGLTQSQK